MVIWVISDTHFGHANMLSFTDNEGNLVRPGFSNVKEMDEFIIEGWNRLVKPQDHVYHLGDVAIPRRALQLCRRLNGHKRLVRGNHDIYKTKEYIDVGFKEIHGMWVISNAVLTHAPIHETSLGGYKGNIHGHIHECSSPEGPYVNVCVECTNYSPVRLDYILDSLL